MKTSRALIDGLFLLAACLGALNLFTGCVTAEDGTDGAPGMDGAPGVAGEPTHLMVYDVDGKRLGLFSQDSFVTYHTDAFQAPDGVYVSRTPSTIYFGGPGCSGVPSIDVRDADTDIANQYWWAQDALYNVVPVGASSKEVNSYAVGNDCVDLPAPKFVFAYLMHITASYSIPATLPWTVKVECLCSRK